jgi:CheY-like chemotaxis protein
MILVVDDDPDFLLMAQRFLPPDAVMFASDGKHAVSLISLLGEDEFSLALVDLNLPVESGFELIPRLRKIISQSARDRDQRLLSE